MIYRSRKVNYINENLCQGKFVLVRKIKVAFVEENTYASQGLLS